MVKMVELTKGPRKFTPLFLRHHMVKVTDLFIAGKPELHVHVLAPMTHSSIRPCRGPDVWPSLIANLLFGNHGLKEMVLVLKPGG